MYCGFSGSDRLGASVLSAKAAVSGWHVFSLAVSSPAHMVKASPGIQATETRLPRCYWLSPFVFQSPDTVDDVQFIDDGSSNPGEY